MNNLIAMNPDKTYTEQGLKKLGLQQCQALERNYYIQLEWCEAKQRYEISLHHEQVGFLNMCESTTSYEKAQSLFDEWKGLEIDIKA